MEERKDTEINVTLTYPNSKEYDFFTKIETIDLDTEAKNDIESGNGFVISSPKSSNKKDMKDPNGIYSSRFGQKLGDVNPYADRYSCECGFKKSRINHGIECPMCHTKVKYVDDDFKMFGWIILKDEYHILHPKFYDSLDFIFGESKVNEEKKKIKGRKLKNILCFNQDVDQDGFRKDTEFNPVEEPFYGIGMMNFYDRFDEILDYYYSKNPKKKPYYDEIQNYKYACKCRHLIGKDNVGRICPECGKPVKFVGKDIIFTHSIPVFTTHLRPADIRDGYMYFEPTNAMYNMINRHTYSINKNKRRMNNDFKVKNQELWEVQNKYMELVGEIMNILTGKRGQLRMLVGGRYNFSCRAVIRQDPTLRVDQIKLPYVELVKCLQQQIINILVRTYNWTPSEAYNKWYRSIAKRDERVAEILNNLIHSNPEGLPVILNRNPTINYGSILQMWCVGFTDTLTISVSPQSIKPMAADFDGDVLNIMHIINGAFLERCNIVFNPRNAMYISRIDGKLNSDLLVQRDTLINANTFIYLGRSNYTQEQLDKIAAAKERQKMYFIQDND